MYSKINLTEVIDMGINVATTRMSSKYQIFIPTQLSLAACS